MNSHKFICVSALESTNGVGHVVSMHAKQHLLKVSTQTGLTGQPLILIGQTTKDELVSPGTGTRASYAEYDPLHFDLWYLID